MLSGIAPLFIFLHQPPEHQASARVSGLCLSATNDVTTPGFVLIVSLTISLWSYRSNCFDCSDRIAGRIVDRIALIALIALTVSLVVSLIASLWFSCSEVFSAFGIIFINCSSNCKRSKTEFTALMNHALTFDHPVGPICIHWTDGSFKVTFRPSSLASLLLRGWPKRKLMLTSQKSDLPHSIRRLSHRLLRLYRWLSFIEREVTPLAPPPSNLERRWPTSSFLSLCSSISAQSVTAYWDT